MDNKMATSIGLYPIFVWTDAINDTPDLMNLQSFIRNGGVVGVSSGTSKAEARQRWLYQIDNVLVSHERLTSHKAQARSCGQAIALLSGFGDLADVVDFFDCYFEELLETNKGEYYFDGGPEDRIKLIAECFGKKYDSERVFVGERLKSSSDPFFQLVYHHWASRTSLGSLPMNVNRGDVIANPTQYLNAYTVINVAEVLDRLITTMSTDARSLVTPKEMRAHTLADCLSGIDHRRVAVYLRPNGATELISPCYSTILNIEENVLDVTHYNVMHAFDQSMAVTRVLSRFFNWTSEAINTIINIQPDLPQEFVVPDDYETALTMWESGPESCMVGKGFKKHPLQAYWGGDFRVAFLVNEGDHSRINARALITHDKKYVRVFHRSEKARITMERRLAKEGYEKISGWHGYKLKAIKSCQPHIYIAPYLDGSCRAGRLSEDKKSILITPSGNMKLTQTNGWSTPANLMHCASCRELYTHNDNDQNAPPVWCYSGNDHFELTDVCRNCRVNHVVPVDRLQHDIVARNFNPRFFKPVWRYQGATLEAWRSGGAPILSHCELRREADVFADDMLDEPDVMATITCPSCKSVWATGMAVFNNVCTSCANATQRRDVCETLVSGKMRDKVRNGWNHYNFGDFALAQENRFQSLGDSSIQGRELLPFNHLREARIKSLMVPTREEVERTRQGKEFIDGIVDHFQTSDTFN
jgi:hypothetical protein